MRDNTAFIIKCLIALLLITIQVSATQAPSEEWMRTFGSEAENEIARSVQRTSDGGYILAGETWSQDKTDALLIKTGPFGGERWSRKISHPWKNIEAYSVQPTSDGYVLAGTWAGDAMLLKTDSYGREVWNGTFGGSEYDCAYSVQPTSDGYVLAGMTVSFGAGSADAWLIKTDLEGHEVWNKTFGGAHTDEVHSVQPTFGGYILVGYTDSFGAGEGDAWLIKTDSEGSMVWSNTFGGAKKDRAYSVQPTVFGYILAGETHSFGDGAWLIKTDSIGREVWNRTFYNGFRWEDYSVQRDSDGGYILAGTAESFRDFGAGDRDAWLIKTDSSGREIWSKTFGGKEIDVAKSVLVEPDGGYVLAGWTWSFGAGGCDAWLIKVEPSKTDSSLF